MKNLLKLPALFVLLLLSEGLTSCVAAAPAVAVRPHPPRRVYYQPRPSVVVVPAPVVVRRRPVLVAPARSRRYVRVR
ncbi:hypothetical protein [Hymenobacter algoricola]|uniref:Uncharacterized protein n=1 Tax=Hymenobacter algoricola TaxID=486267 RepID=A0ABP7N8A0_9BACT